MDLQCLQIFQFPKSAVRQGCNKIHVKLPRISKKRPATEKSMKGHATTFRKSTTASVNCQEQLKLVSLQNGFHKCIHLHI